MRIKFDFPKIGFNADALKRLDPQKFIERKALDVRARIVADTTRGVKAEGGGLKPYSDSYKDQIDSGYIAGKAPGNHNVNLTASGTLMRSIQTRSVQGGAEIFFEGTHPPQRRLTKKGARTKRNKVQKLWSALALGRLGGHVRNSAKGIQAAKNAKLARLNTRIGVPSGNKRSEFREKKAKGSGGGNVPNALIAQAQYRTGRDGWFEISKKDEKAIMADFSKKMDEVFKNLVALK